MNWRTEILPQGYFNASLNLSNQEPDYWSIQTAEIFEKCIHNEKINTYVQPAH
jgi:hypothetical protein